jgi:drug/metabolite transporter (DMT)-like permease
MIWIIISMLCFSVALLAISTASRHIDSTLVSAVLNTVSAIVPVILVLSFSAKKSVESNKFGIAMAALAGVFIAAYGITLAKSYSVNKVGIVTPIIFGGSIFLTTLLSYFIFKEKVSLLQGVGLAFLFIGFGVITYARVTAK